MADLSESGRSRRPHEPGKTVSPVSTDWVYTPYERGPLADTWMQMEPPEWPGVCSTWQDGQGEAGEVERAWRGPRE